MPALELDIEIFLLKGRATKSFKKRKKFFFLKKKNKNKIK